jgi:hypothetical protein
MKNFQQIAAGVDMVPLVNALATKTWLWNGVDIRTKHIGTAHADADDILLRYQSLDQGPMGVVDELECQAREPWWLLPSAARIVLDLMHRVGGCRLGRVVIAKIPPGGKILPHIDGGLNATYYQRYQVSIKSLPGAVFHCGDEAVGFASGDIWWINNRVRHEVVNNSMDDRIATIVDIRVE